MKDSHGTIPTTIKLTPVFAANCCVCIIKTVLENQASFS